MRFTPMDRAFTADEAKRFWSKVNKTDGCWLWTGETEYGTWRYGRFHCHGVRYRAHRVAWVLSNGPIPDGLSVLHKCDNPPCVRPDHLFLGTTQDNSHDMAKKKRQHLAARLTPDEIRFCRSMHKSGLVTHRQLATLFGTTMRNMKKVNLREKYKWVDRHEADHLMALLLTNPPAPAYLLPN